MKKVVPLIARAKNRKYRQIRVNQVTIKESLLSSELTQNSLSIAFKMSDFLFLSRNWVKWAKLAEDGFINRPYHGFRRHFDE